MAIEDFDGHIAPCRVVDGHFAGDSGSGHKPKAVAPLETPEEAATALWTAHFTFPKDPIPNVFFRRNWPILTVRSAIKGPDRPLPSSSPAGAAQGGKCRDSLSAQHATHRRRSFSLPGNFFACLWCEPRPSRVRRARQRAPCPALWRLLTPPAASCQGKGKRDKRDGQRYVLAHRSRDDPALYAENASKFVFVKVPDGNAARVSFSSAAGGRHCVPSGRAAPRTTASARRTIPPRRLPSSPARPGRPRSPRNARPRALRRVPPVLQRPRRPPPPPRAAGRVC